MLSESPLIFPLVFSPRVHAVPRPAANASLPAFHAANARHLPRHLPNPARLPAAAASHGRIGHQQRLGDGRPRVQPKLPGTAAADVVLPAVRSASSVLCTAADATNAAGVLDADQPPALARSSATAGTDSRDSNV